MKILLCAAALSLVLSGCAVPARKTRLLSDDELLQIDTPPSCQGADECARLWRSAQAWVAQHSGYKLQTVTDAVIQTYTPPNYSLSWGFQVVRQPSASGGEQLAVYPTCGPAPICPETQNEMRASFNRGVRLSPLTWPLPPATPVPAPPMAQPAPASPTVQAVAPATATPQTRPSSAPGKSLYDVMRLPEVRACNPRPAVVLIAASPGLETYSAACANGDALAVRCESGNCRVLK